MTFARAPRCGLAVLFLTTAIGTLRAGAQSPQQPPPPAPRPRIEPAPPPTPEDVAAWERLWGGSPDVKPPAPPAGSKPPERTAPLAAADARGGRTRFDDLHATYAAGDTAVIAREFRSRGDFERLRPDLLTTLSRWTSEWSPSRAAFALDVALTAFAQRWPDPGRLLAAARDIVIARPGAFGTKPEDDRFELLFHRSAVAILAALNAPRDVEAYLDGIASRVGTTRDGLAAGRPVDARLALARAAARERLTIPLLLAAASRSDERRTWIAAGDDNEAERRLRAVLEALEIAADHPDTRVEATVRRAFVLHRLGEQAAALETLDAIAAEGDPLVESWRALIRGRILSAIGRPDEAIRAYERAAALAPDAQTPAAALAALHLRLGDRDQAQRWAERARSTPEDGRDPWPAYWMGDSRYLPGWLDEIRRTRS
jgi:tetratricopeptide (TPR) repeat protein